MKTNFSFTFLLFFCYNCLAQQQTSIFFASGKKTLTNDDKAQLDGLIKQNQPFYEVSGYTDSDGSEAQNQVLSQQRAAAVATYLQAKGVTAASINVAYFGESQSINDQLSPQNKQQNRRVTVVSYPNIIENISEIAPPAQKYSFAPSEKLGFVQPSGIAVSIPSNAFKTESSAPIHIEFKDYSSAVDMLLNSLATTTANGRVLESAGMFSLVATQEGNELELKKPINYTFPLNKDHSDPVEQGFQLYIGSMQMQDDGKENMVWIPLEAKAQPKQIVPEVANECALSNCFRYPDDANSPDYNTPFLQPHLHYSEGFLFANDNGVIATKTAIAKNIGKSRAQEPVHSLEEDLGLILYNLFEDKAFPIDFYAIDQPTTLDFEINDKGEMHNLSNTFPSTKMDAFWAKALKDFKVKSIKNMSSDNTLKVSVLFTPKPICCRSVWIEHLKSEATKAEIAILEGIKNGKNPLQDKIIPKFAQQQALAKTDTLLKMSDGTKYAVVENDEKGRTFVVENVGNINLDKPISSPDMLNFLVKTDINDRVSVVFKNRRAVVRSVWNNAVMAAEIRNVPLAEPVLVVALREQNGKTYIAVRETEISAAPLNNLHFELLTPDKVAWLGRKLK